MMKKQWIALSLLTAVVPQWSHAMVDEIFCNYPCGINPGLPPCRECGYTAEVNYLYWKPYQDNNAWVEINKPQNNNQSNMTGIYNTSKLDQTSRDVKYDWDSGFRVGLGADLPCYFWTLGATWTHYDTKASGAVNTDLGILAPSFIQNAPFYPTSNFDGMPAMGSGKALWNFELNQIDFDIQREIIFGYGITLTPFLGLRTEFLKEKYTIEIVSETTGTADIAVNEYTNKLTFNYKAFGLKGGLKSHFDLFCGLGFYGQFALASTYGGLDTSSDLEVIGNVYSPSTGQLAGQITPAVKTTKDINCLRTSCDLSLGLEWRTLFDCDASLFFIRFGWEHHTLFDQNNFLLSTPYAGSYWQEVQGGNLYLYGWTFALGGHF